MKATTKRLVGILLAMAMVLAMLPMAVFAETATTIYLQPNDNWKMDGARFAAYFFGNGETWVDLVDAGDGLYSVEVPAGYPSVIFCRMNPGTTENNWNNKWNQTKDLTVPSDNKVVYVVDGWDQGNGQWIEKGGEIEEVETVYYLRGDMNGWDTSMPLTNNGDGTWSITVDLAASTYQYRIADAGWGTGWPEGNAELTVYSDCAVTFVLNTADGSIEVTGDGLTGEPLPEPEYDYYVAGSEELCGVAWDPAQNKMELNEETGLYEINLSVYTPGTWEYKITTGTWEPSYGAEGGGNLTVKVNAVSDVIITFNAETKEIGCTVKEWGAAEMKWQLNADASADDATVDLRLVTYVTSLDFSNVDFLITIGEETARVTSTTVYESVMASGRAYSCEDLFGVEGYLVTYTIEDLTADFYNTEITVQAEFFPNENNETDTYEWSTNPRVIVASEAF